MTRNLFIAVLALSFVGASPEVSAQATKYWVFFADHAGESVAATHVTGRALARRALRGHGRLDAMDRSVSEKYVRRIEQIGATPIVRSRWLNAVSATMDEAARRRIETLPFVAGIRPVGRSVPASTDVAERLWPLEGRSDPSLMLDYGSSLTQLQVAGMIGPLEAGWNGQGVRLGIIDTWWGDLDHPATRHLVDSGRIVGMADFSGHGTEDDPSRHAFSVLSVAAGFDEGVLVGPAWGAEILLARSEFAPTETNQEEDAFVAAMEWMEAQGADVVNISLGYTVFDAGQSSYTVADMDGNTAVTTIASDLAAKHGVVVVTSAGNEGGCGSPELCWYYVGSPADGDSVITAGGVTSSRTRYALSSWGPTADGRTKPDVAAQASGVYVAVPGGYSFSGGTSFSSPMIAAAAVLLLQARPDLEPMQVREILRSTASQANAPDNSLGWGIIDAGAALALAVGTEPDELPGDFRAETYPNPFTDRATLRIDLPGYGIPARVEIHDLLGRRLWTGHVEGIPGTHELDVDARDWPAGLLVYRVEHGGALATGTMVHLRQP